jgi:putative membrane protein
VLAAAWLVAFAGTLIGFGGFSIARQGDRLRIERGYVIRRAASVPVARIQAVRLVDGLLRQPLGLTQLRVETAGYADERADAQTLFPLMRRDEVAGFLGEFLPELAAPVDPLTPPPRRARRRYVMWPALAGLAAGGALAIGAAGWQLAIAGAALGAAWGLLRFRAAGLALPAGSLVVRSRRLARTTVVARRTSVDIRRATQNPLQRRSDLASIRFAIASGHRFGVAHVDRREAVGALVTLARGGRP